MRRLYHLTPLTVVLVLVVTGSTTLVVAHKGATGVVIDRMMAMEEIGDALRSLKDFIAGKAA